MLINARKNGFLEIKEIPRDKKNTSTSNVSDTQIMQVQEFHLFV